MVSGQAAALEAAIAATLRGHADEPAEKGLITGWVLVVESVGTDDAPYVRLYASEHTPRWRDLGLLQFGVDCLKNALFARQ
jgi:hypothetical protein